jgi:hypothetical protein
MLRLRSKTNPQKLPSLHNTLYSECTYPLRCMGEIVPVPVRPSLPHFGLSLLRQ